MNQRLDASTLKLFDARVNIEMLPTNGGHLETAVIRAGSRLAICLHGFPDTNIGWRDQIGSLADSGLTVWAPNMRGYGQSSRPLGIRAYRYEHLLNDLAGLVDLAHSKGYSSPILISHDWGGIVAWLFVLMDVRPVLGHIVCNCPHPIRKIEGLRTLRQIRKSWYRYFFQLPILPERVLPANNAQRIADVFLSSTSESAAFPGDVIDHYRWNAQRKGGMSAMLNYYRAFDRHQPSMRQIREFGVLKTPTLMIWGEKDHALGVEMTERTNELVEDFTLSRIPDATHWVQVEQPEKFNALIKEWLELKVFI